MRSLHCLLALALAGASGAAVAGTLPLDTGYNHGAQTYYGSTVNQDNYWIKIASYEPPAGSVPVAPAYIYHGATGTAGGLSKVLGPNPTGISSPGTDVSNKAYAIYRKCFCLLSTQSVSLSFKVRGDDAIQVWLNTVTTPLVGPVGWPTATVPQQSAPTNTGMFREGRNCLYVLVEDYWGGTSFSLAGQVTGPGLMPMMAEGNNASFGACPCPEPKPGSAALQEQSAIVETMERAVFARQAPEPAPDARAEVESVPR
jgi:hypothetical protein